MIIETSSPQGINTYLSKIYTPPKISHKGQNGRILVIGGSKLFHSASIWSAQVASYFVDMVHYSSTQENNVIMTDLKSKFRSGIVVSREHLLSYVEEDDAILVGPGMARAHIGNSKFKIQNSKFEDILKIEDEVRYEYELIHYLIKNYPSKQFVFDAGALQVMEADWLKLLKRPAIVTPHAGEFKTLFEIDIAGQKDKEKTVADIAKKYHCIIVLKAVADYISDGRTTLVVKGGNAGLTRGGTGDVLAGLTAALAAKSDPLSASVMASFTLKRTADRLFFRYGWWYNVDTIIRELPKTLFESRSNLRS